MEGRSEGKTPEEKLLNIIENGDGAAKRPPEKKKLNLNLGFFSFSGFDIKKIKMKNVNLGLLAIAFILTIVFIVIFVNKKDAFSQRIDFLITKNKKPSAIFSESEEKKPNLGKYMLTIKRNNPFDLIPVVKSDKKEEVKVSFKLAGIIWSSKPQAIVEETISKKTYTLSSGDSLVGGYKVVKISSGEVIIKGKNGEETLR